MSVVCGYMEVTVLPFVASMPPTANMAPTVALRGRVRGLWSRGRRWGRRWYFIPSISSRWHSILSRSRGLDSRSAKNYTQVEIHTHEHTGVCENCYKQAVETKAGCVCRKRGVWCYHWLWRSEGRKKAVLSLIERLDQIRQAAISAHTHTHTHTHIIWHTRRLICPWHLISFLVHTL